MTQPAKPVTLPTLVPPSAEFAAQARVLCCSADGSQRVVRSVADFLPGAFDVKALESGQRNA